MKKLVIATRRSRLALWQAEHVQARLEALHPGLSVELLAMSTRGDELLETRLDQAGGKGLFVKELEVAMAEGRADLAVHSMKDVPAELPPGFLLAAISEREDPRDAFVSNLHPSLESLPAGARVGTSSLRRQSQIGALRPDLQVLLLRGNVDTRLAKLDRGEYEAIVLAASGLKRLGLGARIRQAFDPAAMIPAPGQGALGVECRADRPELASLLAPLGDAAGSACVRAERAVSHALGGSCSIPLGVFAEPVPGTAGAELSMRAIVASPDGRRAARAQLRGPAAEPEALGREAAARLRAQGAAEILAALGK